MMKKITCNCKKHQCSRCGQCCAMCIPITRKEEKNIRNYIDENDVKPENLFDNNYFYAMCCFYDKKNKRCKIYPVRPSICKSFKCDRNEEELEREKINNHLKAYWNHIGLDGHIKNITTFDLLFYDDPRPLIEYLLRIALPGEIDDKKFEIMKFVLMNHGQKQLAESIVPIYEEK